MADTILITGCSKGIGLALTTYYLKQNWRVIACYRQSIHAKALEVLSQDYPNLIHYIVDLSNEQEIQDMSEALKNESIDIVFNNAGIWGPVGTAFGGLTKQSWLDVFAINTIAPVLVSQALIEPLKKGRLKQIINMSSVMGSIGNNESAGEYIYRSSKSALNAVTKNLAIELKQFGITAIALNPGWVKTDMGGSDAKLDKYYVAACIGALLETITIKNTGEFLSYDGTHVVW